MAIWFFKMLSFAIVGTIGMVIDFGVTWLLKEKAKVNEYVANSIGFIIAVTNNYILNKYWTYKEMDPITAKQFSLFLAISLMGLSLNNLFLYIFHKVFKINFYWAKLFATAFVFLWNFTLNNFLTFNIPK